MFKMFRDTFFAFTSKKSKGAIILYNGDFDKKIPFSDIDL